MQDYRTATVNNNAVVFPGTKTVNSSGGGATDGTELIKAWVDDIWGFNQALLNYTDDTPSGSSEEDGTSQKLDSILKMISNITAYSSNDTHTVEAYDKRGIVELDTGITELRLVGGTGADRTNVVTIYNNTGVTCVLDFGASADQEELTIQIGQWMKFQYDDDAAKFIFIESNMDVVVNTAVDYTIGDWLPSGTIILVDHSASTGIIIIGLSTQADNIGKNYFVKNTYLGYTVIDGEGAETISLLGESKDNIKLIMEDDYAEVFDSTSEWRVKHYNVNIVTNYINRQDYTNVHIGSAFTYDNKSGGTGDLTGEKGTEATSSNTFMCIHDDTPAGAAGICYIVANTGTGVYTNDRVVTFGSGQTVDVNEAVSSKDVDYNYHHGLDINIIQIENKFVVSTDGSDNNSYEFYIHAIDTNSALQPFQIDSNSFIWQTGTAGLRQTNASGSNSPLTASDYYIGLISRVKI